jgi:hypothetical protein
MAVRTYVSARLTHKWADHCSNRDEWTDSIPVKLLQGVLLSEGKSYDEGSTVRYRVIGPKNVDQKMLKKAIRDTFSTGGCSHEYDCCGCPSTYATVKKARKGIFTAIVKTSYNY